MNLGSRQRARVIVGLAVVVRLLLFPFADNKQGDAPMRALIAQRLNIEPGAAADPRTYCQFGPLHLTLMRPFVAVDGDPGRGSRWLSLLAGVASVMVFLRLARRLVDARAAELAGLAVAVSPLHVQLSITAASEALFLLLVLLALSALLDALESRRAGRFALAGAFASLSAVTRYDAWLLWPIVAAAAVALGGRDQRVARARGAALFLAVTAVLPAAWLLWGAARAGDAFFFARYISHDHATLGAAVVASYGGGVARLRQVGIWTLSFAAAMTPILFVAAPSALRRVRQLSFAARLTVVAALAPPTAYLALGLLTLGFEPLARFALVPGVLLLPLAAQAFLARVRAGRRAAAWVALTAAAGSAAVLVAAWAGPGRAWGGAESMGPITRLDDEDRRLADYLQRHRLAGEFIMVDVRHYDDIAVTQASGTPAAQSVTLALTRQPGPSVAATLATTGARWLAVRDDSWALSLGGDWPAGTLRFGRWRLVHADAAVRPGPG